MPISNKEYAWRPKSQQRVNSRDKDEETGGQVAQARRRQQASKADKPKPPVQKPAGGSRKAPSRPTAASRKPTAASRASQATRTTPKGTTAKSRAAASDEAIRKVIKEEEAKDRQRNSRAPAAKTSTTSTTSTTRTTRKRSAA
jgi:hypothetical protein